MVLNKVGWSDSDIELLIKGTPIEALLKPDVRIVRGEPRKLTSPYWRWVVPTQAYASGWLSTEAVQRLRPKLQETEKQLEQFDFSDYPGIDTTNPTVIHEYARSMQRAFADALAMLVAAEDAGIGIFTVIS
jgi:hypothetical protein